MINLTIIPTIEDWGDINSKVYYPDNYHLDFLNKSYNDIITAINQPSGIWLINSSYEIPLKPFIFYMLCILDGIETGKIPLTNYFSEDYFDDTINTIGEKLKKEPSVRFQEFIDPIERIIKKIESHEVSYSSDICPLNEIKDDSIKLIDSIKVNVAHVRKEQT